MPNYNNDSLLTGTEEQFKEKNPMLRNGQFAFVKSDDKTKEYPIIGIKVGFDMCYNETPFLIYNENPTRY